MGCYKVSMTWDKHEDNCAVKESYMSLVTFKKLQTCLEDELDQIDYH